MLRSALRRAQFALWATRLRLALRRRGARLVLDAPQGARLEGFPKFKIIRAGKGDGTFHLRLGRNVTFERDCFIRIHAQGTNVLDVGDDTLFQSGARFWLHSGSVRIGKNTIARDHVCFKTGGKLEVGDHVRLGWCTSVHCHEQITIEDYVGIADLIMIIDSDHSQDGSDTWWAQQPVVSTPIHLGRNALISSNAAITRGARIGRNSVVAAGAVVRAGEYPDGSLLGGVPARG